tara:strand:+ start:931 stop:1191 length:261 start_codon:yes stop_codon:yes gene_type:complete
MIEIYRELLGQSEGYTCHLKVYYEYIRPGGWKDSKSCTVDIKSVYMQITTSGGKEYSTVRIDSLNNMGFMLNPQILEKRILWEIEY